MEPPRDQAQAVTVALQAKAIAVVLHFMDPIGALLPLPVRGQRPVPIP